MLDFLPPALPNRGGAYLLNYLKFLARGEYLAILTFLSAPAKKRPGKNVIVNVTGGKSNARTEVCLEGARFWGNSP